MNRRPEDETTENEPLGPERRALRTWQKPRLEIHGDIRNLTMGVSLPIGESGPNSGTRHP